MVICKVIKQQEKNMVYVDDVYSKETTFQQTATDISNAA